MDNYEARRIIDEIDEAETIDDLKWLLKRIVRELIEDHGE